MLREEGRQTGRTVRVEKKGIRALGIAESFRGIEGKSVLAGVVMRSDLIVDGFVFSFTTIKGDDATEQVIGMFQRLDRNDINVIMIGGAVISLYNIVDVDKIGEALQVPVIALTFKDSKRGLEEAIRRRFPEDYQRKMEAYKRLGGREVVRLKTGYTVFVRCWDMTKDQAKKVLDKFTVQGALPEPIRLAKLLARARLTSAEG